MSGNLASTSFSTGPDEKAEVLDSYVKTLKEEELAPTQAPEVNNEIINTAKKKALDAAAAVKRKKGLFRDVAKDVNVDNGKFSIDVDSASDRLRSIVGANSAIADLKDSIIDKALGFLGFSDDKKCDYDDKASGPRPSNTTPEERAARNGDCDPSGAGGVAQGLRNLAGGDLRTKEGIKAVFGSVVKVYEEGLDVDDAKGAMDLLNTMVDNPEEGSLIETLDIGAQAAMLGSVLDKVSELGIPGGIDIILDKIEDDDQKRDLMLKNLRLAFMRGDLTTIEKALEVVGPAGVRSRVPDGTSLLLTFYRFPRDVTAASKPTERTRLKNILTSLDSGWNTYVRATDGGDITIADMEPFTYAGPDATELFINDADDGIAVSALIARDYPSRQVESVLKQSFPNAVLD